MPNLSQMQASATRQITRWGQGKTAKIWRDGQVRKSGVVACISDWRPADRSLRQDGAARILVQAFTPELDHMQDEIEFAGQRYRIVSPVQGQKPDGVTRIMHDCECLLGASD